MIALTHVPSPALEAGERTHVPRQAIDGRRVAAEHAAYCRLLGGCGIEVRTLDVHRDQPDGVFIEDTAVVLDEVAVLCSMGAASRRAEPRAIEPVLREHREVRRVELPARIEGGDVLRVGKELIVGLSSRTDAAGISALAALSGPLGYTVTAVPVRGSLHLKTACCALPDGRLLVNPSWIDVAPLGAHRLVHVPANEPWGANIALAGAAVLLNEAHAHTAELVRSLGFAVRAVDLSELARAEGGITCLGLFIA